MSSSSPLGSLCAQCKAQVHPAVIMAVEGAPVIDWKKATQGKVFYKVNSP
jgi:hypothetical protein